MLVTVQVGSIEGDSRTRLSPSFRVGRQPARVFFCQFQLALRLGCAAAPPTNGMTKRSRQGGDVVWGDPALVARQTWALSSACSF